MTGYFITFEGIEGSGKSTQISKISSTLTQYNIKHITLREPGTTLLGEKIRQLTLDNSFMIPMCSTTESLLYTAARIQLITEKIRPALLKGYVVLCDRYIDSTIAYQGYGAQGDVEVIRQINELVVGDLWPDRTYLFDLSVELSQQRIDARGQRDRMELKDSNFHNRVRQGYLELSKYYKDRFKVVKADQEKPEVTQKVLADLRSIIGGIDENNIYRS